MEHTNDKALSVTKTLALAAKLADGSGNGTIAGLASPYGKIDRSGDCIFPGAYSKSGALDRFVKHGFVPVGHDWRSLPVAMPTKCEERPDGLYVEAEFHSTEDAQEARTVCMERLAKGLDVGLSVGIAVAPKHYHWFENGQKLLDFAADNGYDLKLFDVKALKARQEWTCGIVEVQDIFEYSIVTIPMAQQAQASSAKSADPGNNNDLRGAPDGQPLVKQLSTAREVVEAVAERVTAVKAMRARKGQEIGLEAMAELRGLTFGLEGLLVELRELDEPTTEEVEAALKAKELDEPTTEEVEAALKAKELALRERAALQRVNMTTTR